jgi:hypothetical protein
MSSNKKKNRSAARNAPAPTPVISPPKPVTETEVDKRQDREITWSFIVAGVSAVLTVASTYYAYQSAQSAAKSADEAVAANKIAQAAQDRAAGKVQARFEFVDDQKRDPERFKEFMRKKDGSDQLVFRIESADELLRWSPYVRIKNTGSEPIDAIKTDVHYDFGAAYGVGVQQIEPAPIVINETSSHEATTFGKLDPGHAARIYVASLLLSQITRLNFRDYADRDHLGMFTVKVYCRLVGASSYDRMPDDQPVALTFHWRPAGFKPDAKNVKELLEKKPWVVID